MKYYFIFNQLEKFKNHFSLMDYTQTAAGFAPQPRAAAGRAPDGQQANIQQDAP